MLGLDYASSDDEAVEDRERENERAGREDETASTVTARPSEVSSVARQKLPSAADALAGTSGGASLTQVAGTKRPAPTPLLNPRQGHQKDPKSIGKVNTLLPPQLRGRANVATQDLEALGIRTKKPTRDR